MLKANTEMAKDGKRWVGRGGGGVCLGLSCTGVDISEGQCTVVPAASQKKHGS